MNRLSPLDVSFLHIEDADPNAHMHIASIGIFEGPPPEHHIITDAVLDRMHLIPRYRQRVQSVPLNLARPVWVDADFDVDYHVRRAAIAAPGTDDQLRQLVGHILSQRLDRTKPLWEIWIVEGLEGGHWASISKTHHSMIDGVSGAELMSVLLDSQPDGSAHHRVDWEPRPTDPRDLAVDALRSLATDTTEQLRATRSALRRPANAIRSLGEIATGMRSMTGVVAPQHGDALTGPIGTHRVMAWAEVPLGDIKAIRTALGGTVNDIVLAAVSNGFRELLLARGDDVDGRVVRTLIPVSVRTKRDDGAAAGDGTLANKVSAMFASLPVGIADPADRLAAIRAQMADVKESRQALAGEALTSLSAMAPSALLSLGARVAIRGAGTGPTPIETITTNVPGPQMPLWSLGRRLVRVYPYVPIIAPVRIGVSIFSYNGDVTFGITGDRDTSPDIAIVARGISDDVAQLVKLSKPTTPRRAKSAAPSRVKAAGSRPRTKPAAPPRAKTPAKTPR